MFDFFMDGLSLLVLYITYLMVRSGSVSREELVHSYKVVNIAHYAGLVLGALSFWMVSFLMLEGRYHGCANGCSLLDRAGFAGVAFLMGYHLCAQLSCTYLLVRGKLLRESVGIK